MDDFLIFVTVAFIVSNGVILILINNLTLETNTAKKDLQYDINENAEDIYMLKEDVIQIAKMLKAQKALDLSKSNEVVK